MFSSERRCSWNTVGRGRVLKAEESISQTAMGRRVRKGRLAVRAGSEKDAEVTLGPQPKSCSQCPGGGLEGQVHTLENKTQAMCGEADETRSEQILVQKDRPKLAGKGKGLLEEGGSLKRALRRMGLEKGELFGHNLSSKVVC